MFKGKLGDMMRKAQEMQEEIQKKTVVGEAGAGAVKVKLNGLYLCERVELSDDILSEDKEIIEALIAAAFNGAKEKVQEMTQNEMSALTAGINLPPGFKLPF